MRWRVSDLASTRGGAALGGWFGGGEGVGEGADVGLVADHGLELADGVLFCLLCCCSSPVFCGLSLVVGGLRHVARLCSVLVMSFAISSMWSISSCTLPVNCPVTYLTTGK